MFKFTDAIKTFLKENCSHNTVEEIVDIIKYPGTSKALRSSLIYHNIPYSKTTRKYFFNEQYFDRIDTPGKAYMYGWFMGDGYLAKDSITWTLTDIEPLLSFRRLMGDENVQIKLQKKQKETYSNAYRLSFYSMRLVTIFKEYGFDNNKTFTCEYPYFIDHKLQRFVVRGLLESDGTVSITNKERLRVKNAYLGTKDVMDGVKNILNLNNKSSPYKRGNVFEYKLTGTCAIEALDWIYQEDTLYNKSGTMLYLPRKYNKYLEAKNLWENRHSRSKSVN